MNTAMEETEKASSSNHHNHDWYKFNIHNLATFRVTRTAPTASLFTDMFHPFLTEDLIDHFDLTITKNFEPLIDGAYGEAHGESDFYYNNTGIYLKTPDIQIFVDEDGFRLHGKSELLVTALPLIDRIMVKHDTAMIHALTVEYQGHGLCMPAWGGAGKTTTMAKLMKMDGFAFMGDDWAFLTESGDLLGYHKPMFIKPYHHSIYPHLFEKTHKPLVPVSLSKYIHQITTLVHPLVSRYPRLAQISRNLSPEHMMVTPQKAFPDARFSVKAPLAACMFVERFQGDSDEPQFEEKSTDWMVTKLIGNFNAEMTRPSRLVMTALGAAGLVPIEQFFTDKANCLHKSISGKPCFYLRVPQKFPPDQASTIICAYIQNVLAQTGNQRGVLP